ncbi:efflux RND transporter periplasmic adaptor subunit [Singulisphaera rosea]
MRRIIWMLGFTFIPLVGVALSMAAEPARDGSDDPTELHLTHCQLLYDQTTSLGAYVSIQSGSRLQDLYVKRGDRVKAGQVVARINDKGLQEEFKEAKLNAANDLEIRSCESMLTYLSAKVKHSETLRKRNMLSHEDWELHQHEQRAAQIDLDKARHAKRVAEITREKVGADLRSRELVSPYDGVVAEINHSVGASLTPNEEVLVIVTMDLMRVVSFIDAHDVWRVKLGQVVSASMDLGGREAELERLEFPGRVVYIDPRIDPMTQTCRVMAEVPNRDGLLRAGIECRMSIYLNKFDDSKPIANPNPPKTAEAPLKPTTAPTSSLANPVRPAVR